MGRKSSKDNFTVNMGRKSRNNNKNNQPHTQASASTHQPNTQLQTTEPPNKRKKRNQTAEQAAQVQPPRQSVFERLGTKNSGTAPLPRQPKDHPSGNEPRKSRRISDARKAEREQSEGEPKQDSTLDATKRNVPISKVNNSNNIVKGGRREEPKPGKPLRRNSHKQLEQKQTIRKDDFKESEIIPLSLNTEEETKEEEEDTKTSHEIPQAEIFLQSPAEYDAQNIEQVASESKDAETRITDETDQIMPENLESGVGSTEFIVQQQNNAVYEHISGLATSDHESDIAKEDVVSIQADDDYLMGIEDEDQEDPTLFDNTEQLMGQDFGESHATGPILRSDRNISPILDPYKDRERKDHGRNKDIDNAKDIPSRMRNRATNSDDGRNSDRSYDRPSRETSIQQSHVDDRRTRLFDIREREREERYNRAIATDRAHDDRNFDRDRRERERQDRYNKSIMEDKAHLDIPRRNERDRFQREFERNHGSRTPNAETSSNSTIRGATSRSPSDSDRDRKPPSRTRSPERVKREDLRPRDDVPRDREWEHRQHQDFQRDRDRISRQREDLSNRDRDSRIRDLSKEKELPSRERIELKIQDRDSMNLRRGDQIDVPFRRLDERISNVRRVDDPRNTGIPDRNPRDLLPRDREKDGHYHRDQVLRPETIRRDERQIAVRSKNETQNDSVFQDREPRQRSIQPNALTEHDHRPDKRKREDIDSNERKTYYDREQRSDVNSFNQRLPDYRIRDKERDQRHREDHPSKDGSRVGINRDQDRDLTNRKDDRLSPTHDRLPDLYRPSTDHHLKEPDRRPIREYERDYRDIGIDRYRADFDRDRRDDRESRSNSVEKTDPHKHLYDRHQRESEKRIAHDIEDDSISRTNRSEPTRRVDTERSVPTVMDNIRDYSQETHMQEDKNRDSQDRHVKESKKVPVSEDEDPPHPWIKCKSSRNKDYYFNTQTRESQWNFPEIGRNRQTQSDSKIIDYDSRKDEDEPGTPRKKIRLNESGDNFGANTDDRNLNPQIVHEDKTLNTMSSVNENDSSNKEDSLKEEIQPETSSRLPRNNSNNVAFLFSPAQSSMSAVFSPPHRSITSEYNERRFSADYGIQSSPRRGSYIGSQPHSPQISSLRPSPNPFNRSGSVDLYDRNDVFRNDDFISNRSLGGPRNITSPGGNNNGMVTPTFPGSPIRSSRSGMYNSFGIDQNISPGSRRAISAGVGRELPIFTQHSPMSRVRTVLEEERQFYGEEEVVDELKIYNHEKSAMGINNKTTNSGQNVGETYIEQNVDEESEEDTWRSDNEPVEYGAADTEPVSIFLFRRAGSRMDQNWVKKKFLNSRKEYEVMKAICGGKGMHLFKHSFATAHRGE